MNHREVIGLVPAGGRAARLGPLPCSKELYPIGFRTVAEGGALRSKVICHYLLERMRFANITKAYIILREGKWDIPAYLKDGKILDMNLAYLMMDLPFGVPYTLDQAYPFVRDSLVALGFPDTILQPDDAFVRLIARQSESRADLVMGLFPANHPHKVDMVDIDPDGRICGIQIKPAQTHLRYTWLIAVWTPDFTHFMHEYVTILQERKDGREKGINAEEDQELFVGHVIQAAIHNNMRIDTVLFPKGKYLDIGSPEDMVKAVQFKI